MTRTAPIPFSLPAKRLIGLIVLAAGIDGLGWSAAASLGAPSTRPSSDSPASVPTTHPATGPTAATGPAFVWSRQTPRDALKWFAAALRDGDVPRLRAVVLAAVPAEGKMIEAMGDMARSLALLHQSAEAAYGVESAARFTDDTAANFDRTLARIDAAEVSIDGDLATVRYPKDKENSFQLHKLGKDWLIPAAQFTSGAAADIVDRRADELLSQAQVVKDLAKDIATGKYRTADAASAAWRGKMMARPSLPATQKGE